MSYISRDLLRVDWDLLGSFSVLHVSARAKWLQRGFLMHISGTSAGMAEPARGGSWE